MTKSLLPVLAAAVCGLAIALQAQCSGLLERGMGTLESVFFTYFGGGLLIFGIMAAMGWGNISAWDQPPWYAYFSGVLGLVIVGTIAFSVPRLGLVSAFTVIVAVQFVFGGIMDHFGLMGAQIRPVTLSRAAGMALVLAGVYLSLR